MEQAGILGDLAKYDELTFSKMLTQGYKFGAIEARAWHHLPTSREDRGEQKDNPSLIKNSDELQQHTSQINKWFSQQRWNIEVPLYDLDTIWELEEKLDDVLEYIRKIGPCHGPYFLIGNAAGMLLSGSTDDDVLCRIQKINITFSNTKVKESALFTILKDLSTRTKSPRDALTLLKQTLQACHDRVVILFLAAAPKNLERVSVGREFETLKEAIRNSPMSDGYKIESVHSCRLQDITKALRNHKPTILHFSGHANASALAFEDGSGDYSPIELSRLVNVMKQGAQNGLRYVLLNACSTAEQSDCIANEVGCVIAMKDAVGDEAAITFTQVFYSALAAGHSVQTAFDWAQPETKLLHKDLIRPQIIRGGIASGSSNLEKRGITQAKNDASGLASFNTAPQTSQFEGAKGKLVQAERSVGESTDEGEQTKDENEPESRTPSPANVGLSAPVVGKADALPVSKPTRSDAKRVIAPMPPKLSGSTGTINSPPLSSNNTVEPLPAATSSGASPVATAKRTVDQESPLAQNFVPDTNVQESREKRGSAAIGAQKIPHSPAATMQGAGPWPAKEISNAETSTSLPTKSQSTTSTQSQVIRQADANLRPNTGAPSTTSTRSQTDNPPGAPRPRLPASIPSLLRPLEDSHISSGPTTAGNRRQSPFHSNSLFSSHFFDDLFSDDPFFNDPFFGGLMDRSRPASSRMPAARTQNAEPRVRELSGCDFCKQPFTDEQGVICKQCNNCTKVACLNCVQKGVVPCLREKHKASVVKLHKK